MSVDGFIDLHYHALPDFYVEDFRRHFPGDPTTQLPMPAWSKADALALMDEAGISVGLVSAAFGVHFGDTADAVALARRFNEFSAEMVAERPDRFGALAALPLPDVDAALAEIAHSLDELQLDGVLLMSNHAGTYLGDPAFDVVFDELQARRATVFVHPEAGPDRTGRALGLPDFLLDFPVDTSRAIARLQYSGTFARTPDVNYVFSHGGGTIPYIASRFELADGGGFMPGHGEWPSAAETFRRLYWDTAIAFSPAVIALLQQVAGTSQIVYGSDYPFTGPLPVASTRAILGNPALSTADKDAIRCENARRILPRFA